MNDQITNERRGHRRLLICVAAALLAVSITVGILVVFLRRGDEFSFTGSELSEYISIGEEDYKGYGVEVVSDRVDGAAVEREISRLLYSKRSSRPENNGGEVTSLPVTLGDKVYIYYAVKLEEEGREEIISQHSLFLGASAYGVGSYSFLPIENIDRSLSPYTVYANGFDEALIGAVPSEHKLAAGETLTSGRVSDSDGIVFSYTDGGKRRSFKTTLSECDALYGEGMRSFLLGAEIGAETAEVRTELDGKTVVYNNIRIEYAQRSARAPLIAEVSFPTHYAEPTLRGRRATVEVYFRGSVVYNVPEYNAEFITETLGIDGEELSEYEGADIVERHRAMLRSELASEADNLRELLASNAVWEHLVSRAKVNELPREELERAYDGIYSGLYMMYANVYSAVYDTPEKFSAWYYGLEDASEVAAHVMSLAEREVTEKLIFYHIARTEGLLPVGEKFDALYESLVDEELKFYTEGTFKAELDALEGAAREKRLAELRLEMLESYGEEYFTELAYYESAFPTILGYAEVRFVYSE